MMQPSIGVGVVGETFSPPRKRVAIVGSGIAGLTSAWVLSRDDNFDVTIIESEKSLGMDAHSFNLAEALPGSRDDGAQRLDMPLRVFSESYYPNLTRLYAAAGVTFHPEDYCGSFLDVDGSCLFKYNNFLIGPYSLPWILPRFLFQRKPLELALEYLRFIVVARRHTKNNSIWIKALETMTFGEYLQRGGYSSSFVHKFIVRAMPAYSLSVLIELLLSQFAHAGSCLPRYLYLQCHRRTCLPC